MLLPAERLRRQRAMLLRRSEKAEADASGSGHDRSRYDSGRRSSARRNSPLEAAFSITLVVLLAASWLLAGHLVTRVSPMLVAAGRTGGSFVVLTLVALLYRRSRRDMRFAASRVRSVALLGFLGFFAYYAGTMIGTGFIGASRVGLITSLLPSITFAIGVIAFGEPSTRSKKVGTLLAVSGAIGYVLAEGEVPSGGSSPGGATMLWGGMLGFGGTFAYALYGYIYQKRLSDLSSLGVLPAITGVGTVMLVLAVILFVPLDGIAVMDLVGIAALGTVLTAPVFLLLHELILRKGPLFTAALSLAVPFSVRIGEWMLGWASAPNPLVLFLLLICAIGVGLTIRGGQRVAERPSA